MLRCTFTRSSFSSRSLHLALGVMVGILEPSPAAFRRRCLRPTRGGGGGGSHFFFFSPCNAMRPSERVLRPREGAERAGGGGGWGGGGGLMMMLQTASRRRMHG